MTDLEKDISQHGVVLAVEFHLPDPAEAEEDCEDGEDHDGGVRDVGQEDR